jgi:hypothetical protein
MLYVFPPTWWTTVDVGSQLRIIQQFIKVITGHRIQSTAVILIRALIHKMRKRASFGAARVSLSDHRPTLAIWVPGLLTGI